MLKDAYEYYCNDADTIAGTKVLLFEDWCQKRLREGPQFHFWHIMLSMELIILSLVRDFRETNLTLYSQALCAMIPFLFANNDISMHDGFLFILETFYPGNISIQAFCRCSNLVSLLSSSPAAHSLP